MAKKVSLSQEFVSNSDNSGSEEEKPKPTKKRAAPAPKKAAKKAKKDSDDEAEAGELLRNDDGDSYILLGPAKRITVRKYKGATLIDIRETYEKDGKAMPGKKGISLNTAQWEALTASVAQINQAIADV